MQCGLRVVFNLAEVTATRTRSKLLRSPGPFTAKYQLTSSLLATSSQGPRGSRVAEVTLTVVALVVGTGPVRAGAVLAALSATYSVWANWRSLARGSEMVSERIAKESAYS